jgi:hypothetical protein
MSSHDTTLSLPAAAAALVDTDADLVKGTRATGRWTPEEDLKLKNAVANTRMKKHGSKYRIDWAAVVAQVPGRMESQCADRWRFVLDPSIDRVNMRTGKWTEDESIKLKDAVQTHGGKNWQRIAALFPGRTIDQCRNRWRDVRDPKIDYTVQWTVVEDIKLKDGVQAHGGKNWAAIAALVQGRTKKQCNDRWRSLLNPSVVKVNSRTSTWTEDESEKLKDAVERTVARTGSQF